MSILVRVKKRCNHPIYWCVTFEGNARYPIRRVSLRSAVRQCAKLVDDWNCCVMSSYSFVGTLMHVHSWRESGVKFVAPILLRILGESSMTVKDLLALSESIHVAVKSDPSNKQFVFSVVLAKYPIPIDYLEDRTFAADKQKSTIHSYEPD